MYARLLGFACGPNGQACYDDLVAALTVVERKYNIEATQLAAAAAAAVPVPVTAPRKKAAAKQTLKGTASASLRNGVVAAAARPSGRTQQQKP